MWELILRLIPLGIVAAVQPLQILALVVLLQTRQGVRNGFAYVTGITIFRLALGTALYLLLTGVEQRVEADNGNFDLVVGTVLAVLGVFLMVLALRRWLRPEEGDESSGLVDRLQNASPTTALLVGVGMLALDPRDWLIDLAAVDLIAAADLTTGATLVAYGIYNLVALSLLLVPLLVLLVSPASGQGLLARINQLLTQHARPIEIGFAAFLGGFFLVQGLATLGIF